MKYTLAFFCSLLVSSFAMAEPIPSNVICYVSKGKFECNSEWVEIGGTRLGCSQKAKFRTANGAELVLRLNADHSVFEMSEKEVRDSIREKIEEYPKCSKGNSRIFAGERESKEVRGPNRSPESSSSVSQY